MLIRYILVTYLLFIFSDGLFASIENARKLYVSKKSYNLVAKELIRTNHLISAVPFVRSILNSRRYVRDKSIDNLLEKLVSKTGIHQFELISSTKLNQYNLPMTNYILAKKYFKKGQYRKAISETLKISERHSIYPFALLVRGAAYSIIKNYTKASDTYKECMSVTKSKISSDLPKIKLKQLEINHDYCLIGKARNLFAQKKYDEAELAYLDLPKSSYVWPEILFEEAWNSLYQKNHNRTLGKLVTYYSPFLRHVFNPEIEILKTLTFYEMCLWDDTTKEADNFYNQYQRDYRGLQRYLSRLGKKYGGYFALMEKFKKNTITVNPLVGKLLNSIQKELAYSEINHFIRQGLREYKRISSYGKSPFQRLLLKQLKISLQRQKLIAGKYIRSVLYGSLLKLKKGFQDMSYIKLEVLARKKEKLYAKTNYEGKKRGDLKYLKRNEKQYFWTFNGEFWADELGDFVFALKSECK